MQMVVRFRGARSAERPVLVRSREDDSHAEAHGEKTTE